MFEQLDLDLRTTDIRDLEFARRSVQYMIDKHCTASQIFDALTSELDLSAHSAHHLLRETTALVRRLRSRSG